MKILLIATHLLAFVAGGFAFNKASASVLHEYEVLVGKLKQFEEYLKSLEGRTVLSAKELVAAVERIFGKK